MLTSVNYLLLFETSPQAVSERIRMQQQNQQRRFQQPCICLASFSSHDHRTHNALQTDNICGPQLASNKAYANAWLLIAHWQWNTKLLMT